MAANYRFCPMSIDGGFEYYATSVIWGNMVLMLPRSVMQSTEFQATFEAMICKVADESYAAGRRDVQNEIKNTLGIR